MYDRPYTNKEMGTRIDSGAHQERLSLRRGGAMTNDSTFRPPDSSGHPAGLVESLLPYARLMVEQGLGDTYYPGENGMLELCAPLLSAAESAALIAHYERFPDRWKCPGNAPREPSARKDHPERSRVTPAVRRRVMERDRYRCRRCGTHFDLEIDHVIALANGGTSDEDNLQTLCGPCNRAKGVT